jgi:hypothetical protein
MTTYFNPDEVQAPPLRLIVVTAGNPNGGVLMPAAGIDNNDGTASLAISGGGGGGGTSYPEAFVLYDAAVAGTGYAVGDVIARITTATSTSTAVSYWANATQNTILSTAPTIANLIPISTRITEGSTATRSSVASSISTVSLLAANPLAFQRIITNASSATLYVIFGTGGSVTDFTYAILPNAILETKFSGVIGGVWSAANGFAYVTEVTK